MVRKAIVIIISSFLLSSYVSGQSAMDKLWDKYSGQEGITSVFISKYMFDMFRNIEAENGEEEFQHVISKLNGIKILATKNQESAQKINLHDEIFNGIKGKKYEELMVIRDEGEDVKFLVLEEKGKIAELLMIVTSPKENVIISIQGNLDMNDLAKLSKTFNIEGMERLEQLDE